MQQFDTDMRNLLHDRECHQHFSAAKSLTRKPCGSWASHSEMARVSVKRDWGGIYASHIIAKRIIELAKGGERNPDVLCVQALSYFLRP
jgi:hypothetical protein